MYNELRKEYREALLKLTSSLKTDGSDKIELARLFIRIGEDIILKNSSGSKDLKYYNDAAIHYTYAINISKKLLESQRNESTISLLQPIIAKSETKLKELYSIILGQIASDNSGAIAKKVGAFSLDEVISDKFTKLQKKREETNALITKLQQENAYKIKELFEDNSNYMKNLLSELYKIAQSILEQSGIDKKTDYVVIGLGSMAIKQITLYSDFEHAIIVKEYSDDNILYCRQLAYLVNFMVINFSETIIPTSKYGIDMSHFINQAVSFDLGGKTPLGRIDGEKPYDLIGTVDWLMYYVKNDQNKIVHIDKSLPYILENICYVYGCDELYKVYSSAVKDYLSQSHKDRAIALFEEDREEIDYTTPEKVARSPFAGDLEKLEPLSGKEGGKPFEQKHEIYRLADRMVYNLGLYYNLSNESCSSAWDILQKMKEKKILNEQGYGTLKKAVDFAMLLRLRTYDYYKAQVEHVSLFPKEISTNKFMFHFEDHELQANGALFQFYYTFFPFYKKIQELTKLKPKDEQAKSFFSDESFFSDDTMTQVRICIRLHKESDALQQIKEIINKKGMFLLENRSDAIEIGILLIKRGMYEQSSQLFNTIKNGTVRHNSIPDIVCDLNLAQIESSKGEYDKAISLLNPIYEWLTENPNSKEYKAYFLGCSNSLANAYDNRGLIYCNAEDHGKAIKHFEEMDKKSWTSEIYNNAARAYCNRGDYRKNNGESIEKYQKDYEAAYKYSEIGLDIRLITLAYKYWN